MKVLVTGGTGYVGRFIVEALLDSGHEPFVAARVRQNDLFSTHLPFRPFFLEPDDMEPSTFAGMDGLVHCAFHHVPERYRGGEGDDPETFWRLNVAGTVRLFELARLAGVGRTVFLSSRAVYGPCPAGTVLDEGMECRPDTLYGRAKLEGEHFLKRLASREFDAASLRITGVFGLPGQKSRKGLVELDQLVADLLARQDGEHKWRRLFCEFGDGKAIPPRIGTEIHGDDVGQIVCLLLGARAIRFNGRAFNLPGTLVDRRELLGLVREYLCIDLDLPSASDPESVNVMTGGRLERVLGGL